MNKKLLLNITVQKDSLKYYKLNIKITSFYKETIYIDRNIFWIKGIYSEALHIEQDGTCFTCNLVSMSRRKPQGYSIDYGKSKESIFVINDRCKMNEVDDRNLTYIYSPMVAVCKDINLSECFEFVMLVGESRGEH